MVGGRKMAWKFEKMTHGSDLTYRDIASLNIHAWSMLDKVLQFYLILEK